MAVLSLRSQSKKKEEKPNGVKMPITKDSGANCVISKGTKIEGDFSSAENIRLDGIIVGKLKCDQRLVVGESGKVEGTVNTNEAVIMGRIIGNIISTGTLHLAGSAYIEGDIQAKLLVVDEGAKYLGKCQVNGN